MTPRSESDLLDGAEEQALRDLYYQHAPEHVESEHAWAAIAPRLALQSAGARQKRGLRLWAPRPSGERRGRRAGLGVAAALVALPLLLMGAGLAKEQLMALDPGMQRIADEHLYREVGQSQTQDGVTITVTAAYADEGRSVFYYHIQLSPALARQYQRADIGSWDFTDGQVNTPTQSPNVSGGLGTCAPWDIATRSASCYMIDGPFTAGATASQITLILAISRVYLTSRESGSREIRGLWRFQFAIPYHHNNIGSVEQFFPHLLHLAPTQSQP